MAAMNCCFSLIRPYQQHTAVEHLTILRTLFTAFHCSVRLNERENHFFVPQHQDPTNLLRVTKGAFHLTNLTGQTWNLEGLTPQRLQINKPRG